MALLAVVLPGTFHGWPQYLAIFVVVYFTINVFDMILVARLRQRVVDYIREHGHEIQSVA